MVPIFPARCLRCPKRNSSKCTVVFLYQHLKIGTPRTRLRSTWEDASSKSLEAPQTVDHLQKALITIAYAIGNSCEPSALLPVFSANTIVDEADWDVTRLADRVKNTRPRGNGEPAVEDLQLERYFSNPELGDLDEPATIVDQFGRIMVWYLPGIFYASLIVSLAVFHIVSKNNLAMLEYLQYGCYSTQKATESLRAKCGYWRKHTVAKNWLSARSSLSEWPAGPIPSLVPSRS